MILQNLYNIIIFDNFDTYMYLNWERQLATTHLLSVTTHLIGCTDHHWCVGYDGEEQLRLKQQFGARQRKLDKCEKKYRNSNLEASTDKAIQAAMCQHT